VRSLSLDGPERLRAILAVGAHADDIEIGCGGTLLRLARTNPQAHLHWVVLSARGDRAVEAERSAYDFGAGFAEVVLEIKDHRDGFFPYSGADVKEYFEHLKDSVEPDVIFTHRRDDLHQDHRVTGELTWNTFRNHLILEYEIPKYDGDLGAPNVFAHLPAEIADRKVELLMEHFGTQQNRHWFTADVFQALLRLRGMESNAPSGYAEAYYCRKLAI
jgi:LmbE family N-acetylglucosaminyl deacetylase